ncbi:BQ2448_2087 [Microbotryum intermedium]|uniref:BQ2448_2087 protein n=1 Tax=Microbotryum intermedium TaxID=269621 RepID=A0A238F7E1_9BASI|nr:BQ2448_2087 [Microbotryum intermedium]
MAPRKYRVQCCTYNGHLAKGHKDLTSLASWLAPTLEQGNAAESEAPDFFAVGFQEMIPLHLALVGLSRTALDQHDHQIQSEIEQHTSSNGERETYTLMAKQVLGGIALLVFTRDATVTNQVVDVRVATVACGIFRRMGNKGGVGVRITLDSEGDESSDSKSGDDGDYKTGNNVFTFVTAHLAAHDSGLQRRNEDYQSIVERLIFTPDGPSQHYRPQQQRNVFPRIKSKSTEGIQIYDTTYLFFFGDLNYRISTVTPKNLTKQLIARKIHNDLPALLTHDQLRQEQAKGRTLHHLREGEITFQPTYKFKVGTVDTYKAFTKRIPGWTDRILFSCWSDGESGAGEFIKRETLKSGQVVERSAKRKGAKVELYTSIMSFTGSDHKPVTAILALPRHPNGSSGLRLPFTSPYPIDQRWRRKKVVGKVLDRFVGFCWCVVMLCGLGKDARLGIATLVIAATTAYYKRTLLGV